MRLFLGGVAHELVRGVVLYTMGFYTGDDFHRVEFTPEGCLVDGVPREYKMFVTDDEASLIKLMARNPNHLLTVGFPTTLEHARFEITEPEFFPIETFFSTDDGLVVWNNGTNKVVLPPDTLAFVVRATSQKQDGSLGARFVHNQDELDKYVRHNKRVQFQPVGKRDTVFYIIQTRESMKPVMVPSVFSAPTGSLFRGDATSSGGGLFGGGSTLYGGGLFGA